MLFLRHDKVKSYAEGGRREVVHGRITGKEKEEDLGAHSIETVYYTQEGGGATARRRKKADSLGGFKDKPKGSLRVTWLRGELQVDVVREAWASTDCLRRGGVILLFLSPLQSVAQEAREGGREESAASGFGEPFQRMEEKFIVTQLCRGKFVDFCISSVSLQRDEWRRLTSPVPSS